MQACNHLKKWRIRHGALGYPVGVEAGGRGEIGRRSRLCRLECLRGNPQSRTAQSRGTLTGAQDTRITPPGQSRAKPP